VWAFVLLERSADWYPWLRFAVLAAGIATAVMLVVGERIGRRLALAAACAGVVIALAGPAAYSLQTAASAHTGSLPSAGPVVAGASTGPGGPGGGGMQGGAGGPGGAGSPPSMAAAGTAGAAPPALSAGGFGGQDGAPPTGGSDGLSANGDGPGGGAGGGLLDASRPSAALKALLTKNAARYTWVAATVGAQSAAGYQLATGDPVMSLGGFNGSDPYPTLAEFQALVRAGRVHYFIATGTGGGGGAPGSSSMSAITPWVTGTYTSQTVGGITLYDLTSPATASSE